MKKYTPLWIILILESGFLIISENFSFETFVSIVACIPVIVFTSVLAFQFWQVKEFNGLRLVMTGFFLSTSIYFLWLGMSLCIYDTGFTMNYSIFSSGWRRFISILPIDFFSYKLYFYLQKLKKK